jgi:hypothetical protein
LTEQLVLDVLPYPSSSIQFSKIAKNPRAAERPRGSYQVLDVSLRGPQQLRISMCDPFRSLVEIAGIEPATSGLQSRRSPN